MQPACDRCQTTTGPLTLVRWVGGHGVNSLASYYLCATCLQEAKLKDGEHPPTDGADRSRA